MWNNIAIVLFCLTFCTVVTSNENDTTIDNVTTFVPTETVKSTIDMKTYRERLNNQTLAFENWLKKIVKDVVRSMLPRLMEYNNESSMSSKCTNSLMKYVSGLGATKVWAVKMFDSMSKPPSGIFEGTLSDFGAFDQCLEIELPKRNGDVEFTGRYCAIEAAPIMPPQPKNFSMAKQVYAKPLDTISKELRKAGMVFYYMKARFGICVPSTCTLQDMQSVAKRISDITQTDIRIPQCYVKESPQWKPIHIAVICILSALLLACILGSIVEYNYPETSSEKLSTLKEILKCFSLISNYTRLISASKGSNELKALHGIKAISMFWVILGHSYVWTNFQLLRRPNLIPKWFNRLDFGVITNTWLAVEVFFFMSGLLTSLAVLKVMAKTKGRISVPIYIIRRYVRLTPALLLTIGLLFFLPLISSGPFWYERLDPELEACTGYWWTSILYVSNWWDISSICVHPTWYLSADFQLHVVSIIAIFILYKYPKLGLVLISVIVIVCNVAVGILTYVRELPPIILVTSGNNAKIQETLEIVHIRTFTHAGPYYIGIVVGYMMIKYNQIKISRVINICGWCVSTALALLSVYGAHRWNIGEPHGPLLTAIFAAMHRTTFTLSVAWVTFVCVSGNGGLVNKFLSSSMLAPLSRLTFMMYLFHSLIIWMRKASLRERIFFSHYNVLYEYTANVVVTVLFSIPFYLLLEAPLSNLERLFFSRLQSQKKTDKEECRKENGHLNHNVTHFAQDFMPMKRKITSPASVELRAVKNLDTVPNGVASNKNMC